MDFLELGVKAEQQLWAIRKIQCLLSGLCWGKCSSAGFHASGALALFRSAIHSEGGSQPSKAMVGRGKGRGGRTVTFVPFSLN
jgi:hypothetical protein